MTRTGPAACLALNGALLMLAGLLAGAAIPAVPYPRLMLSAHNAGFTVSGLASVVIWAHVALWPLSLSEVAAAFWGTTKALPLAGAEAGATGGTPWQEAIVIICHALPALALMAAWVLLVWGTWGVFRRDRTLSSGGLA